MTINYTSIKTVIHFIIVFLLERDQKKIVVNSDPKISIAFYNLLHAVSHSLIVKVSVFFLHLCC